MFQVIDKLKQLLPLKYPSDERYWNEQDVRLLLKPLPNTVEIENIWYRQLLLVRVLC